MQSKNTLINSSRWSGSGNQGVAHCFITSKYMRLWIYMAYHLHLSLNYLMLMKNMTIKKKSNQWIESVAYCFITSNMELWKSTWPTILLVWSSPNQKGKQIKCNSKNKESDNLASRQLTKQDKPCFTLNKNLLTNGVPTP